MTAEPIVSLLLSYADDIEQAKTSFITDYL